MSEVEVKEEHVNGDPPPDPDAASACDPRLKELQDSITHVVADGELNDPMKLFLGCFGTYLGGVSEQLNTLSSGFSQLSEALDKQSSRLEDIDGKVSRICKRLNIYVPMRPPDKPVAASKKERASSPASSTTSGKVQQAASSAPKTSDAEKTDAELKEMFPNVTVLAGMRDPLAFAFFFPFRVGDYVFSSMEQALFYIKYKVMNRPDLAARVKKTTNPVEVTQVGTIATGDEWTEEVQANVALALFRLRFDQSKPFAEKVEAVESEQSFVFATQNAIYGCGQPRATIASVLPDKYKGQNLYGNWLEEFCTKVRKGEKEDSPFNVEEHCKFDQVELPQKEQVLVLGDGQLTGFKDRLNTKLIFDATMTASVHPIDEAHTAKNAVEKLPEGELEKCAAIVLLIGTHEVGKTPDKLETEYTELLKLIREKSEDVPVFIGNAFPRTDKLQDKVDVTNYAIRTAVRNFNDPKVVVLELEEKFSKLPNYKTLLKTNGRDLTEAGAEKLAEFLAAEVPFISMVCPKKPISTATGAAKGTARGRSFAAAGPPAKRGRGAGIGAYGQARGAVASRFGGSRMSMPGGGGQNGYGGGFPVAAGPGYGGSPWGAGGAAAANQNRMLGIGVNQVQQRVPYGGRGMAGRGGMPGGQGYYTRFDY